MSGCWVGFKIVTAVADAVASVAVDPDRIAPVWPEVLDGARPWRHVQHARYFVPDTIEMERELHLLRHEAARQYAAANQVNTIKINPVGGWLCIVAAGRTFVETRHALGRLGLGDAELAAAGIRLVRVGMIFPLDRDIIRQAASGVQEVLVIEEKRSFLELFVRDALYGTASAPAVTGKRDEAGRPLVPVDGELTADRAESFFRLLAYKDEYEVARLYLLPEFMTALRRAVPEPAGLRIMLHPPVLRALGMRRKLALPSAVAFPAFRVLRTMRRLRGTALDPFGYTSVRRTERWLAHDYETGTRAALADLSPAGYDVAIALARLPQSIRGYEGIKLESVRGYTSARNELLAEAVRQ
jgi:hypothetical protein